MGEITTACLMKELLTTSMESSSGMAHTRLGQWEPPVYWICQPMTNKGKREVLKVIEVKDITTPFPRVDLKEATAEIKASDPHNGDLQTLTLPDSVGRVVNVLLGIQYAAHYPRLVHQLEGGITIYEVKLEPGSNEFTAAIAGPHHSFELILNHMGDMVTMLTSFTNSLVHWKHHGPRLQGQVGNAALYLLPANTHSALPHCTAAAVNKVLFLKL